ncbi:MAG: V-type ATP synthase subunit E [Actinobacteria bacterium]|nr:V-type ATP synthase subunit E [Actinomycetota bacterium]
MTEMDNVSKKVLEDAQNIRKENLKEAEEKASGIRAEAEYKIKDVLKEGSADAKEHYSRTYDMEVFKARSSLDQKMLLEKIKLVDSVIARAKEKLSGLDRGEWEKFLKKTIAGLGIKEGTYIIGSSEKVLDGDLARSVTGLKPATDGRELKKGLKIFEGKAEYDLTPEKYLDIDIEDLKMEIASYLFKKGE